MVIGFRLIVMYRNQRNECAEALRRLLAANPSTASATEDQLCAAANDHEAPAEMREYVAAVLQARAAIAKVPTATEMIRRIWALLREMP